MINWNYSNRAATYDKRADYSKQAVFELIEKMGLSKSDTVADIGAGTGKLTGLLLEWGLNVLAVEPNDNMRSFGIKNTEGKNVTWSVGTGENTNLPAQCAKAAFFGSSFNVVDQGQTLQEVARILVPGSFFACMWNHRDLEDPLQKEVEDIIKASIPDYNYGKRRQDPTEVVNASGLFGQVESIKQRFDCAIPKTDWVDAWKSHETLARQAKENFNQIIEQINTKLADKQQVNVPYTTNIWFAKLK